jgi:hypothetical protein
MPETRERYLKLPGHRRGFIKGSSLWLGGDHLLLVKSTRVREEYKRFLLRDIQAIVVASMPRFFISTRAFSIGVLWVIAYFALRNRAAFASIILWTCAASLVIAWIFLCARYSCTCRIFTAVSRDDLPSLYRTWTVRKFLEQVEPRIAEAQGVVEGDWAETVEARTIGPPMAQFPAAGTPDAGATPQVERSRTPATDVFVASLFVHALYIMLTIHSTSNLSEWTGYGLAGLQLGIAVVIFMQYRRGTLRPPIPKLAIAALLAVGGSYYARQIIYQIASAGSPASELITDPKVLVTQPAYTLLRQADAVVAAVLGVAGVVVSFLRPRDAAMPRSMAG